jgi:hypothetical protein
MEATSQENRPVRRHNYFITALAAVVAFFAGLSVGLHPSWLPVKSAGDSEMSQPIINGTPGADRTDDHAAAVSQTLPTTEPTTAP